MTSSYTEQENANANANTNPGNDSRDSRASDNPTSPYVPMIDVGEAPNRRGNAGDVELAPLADASKSSGATPSAATATATATKKPITLRKHLGIFWDMSRPYFSESREGKCLLGGLVVLMLLDSAARIAFSYLARDFWSALGDKDAERFYGILLRFLVALCLLAPINVLYRFQKQTLAIRWRKWMTERLLLLYFDNPHQIYYRLEQRGRAAGISIPAPEASSLNAGEHDNEYQYQHQHQYEHEHEYEHEHDTNTNTNTNTNTSIDAADESPRVDNPDQRVAEDVRSFTQYSLTLFLTIAVSLIDLSAFSVVLYTIEPKLFVSIVGFATFGTLATCLLGRDLVRLNVRKLAREADFRYSLVRVRENAESIAFFGGEATEGEAVRNRFGRVLSNAMDVIRTQRNLEFFTTSYSYLTWILPVVVVAPEYMAGNVELGVVQQAAAAFGHILDDLSLIINEFEGLSEFSASITRLHQFLLALRDAHPRDGENNGENNVNGNDNDSNDNLRSTPLLGRPTMGNDGIFKTSERPQPSQGSHDATTNNNNNNNNGGVSLRELPPGSAEGVALSIRNLDLYTPDSFVFRNPSNEHESSPTRRERALIRSLDLELQWGERLLIIGPSGIGKSSLLRAIAGLWTSGSGIIERANISDVYFLPQKPYCPLGSLRDQLLYPSRSNASASANASASEKTPSESSSRLPADDIHLLRILERADLSNLAKRSGDGDPFRGLDAVLDWGNVLSLGEQQRLAFARVLIHEPRLVILDEATSAMDVSAEEKMYGLLEGLTCVSVGHRPTLLRYHTRRLQLHKRDGDSDSGGDDPSVVAKLYYTLGDIRSTAETVANGEVDWFYR